MPKALKVAGEVDSWCTSCRMLLNHRVVSMLGTKPHQVLCLTCKKEHRYKAGAPGERAAAEAAGARAGAPAKPARVTSATRAEQARVGRERDWQKAVNGSGVNDFKPYSVGGIFDEGDLIRHKKFGDGVVTRVIDAVKIEVLFKDEPKTLAHGLK